MYIAAILDTVYQDAIDQTARSAKMSKLTLKRMTKALKDDKDFIEFSNMIGLPVLKEDDKEKNNEISKKNLKTKKALDALRNMRAYQVPIGVYVMLDDLKGAIKDHDIQKIKLMTDSMLTYSIPSGFMLEVMAIRHAFSIKSPRSSSSIDAIAV